MAKVLRLQAISNYCEDNQQELEAGSVDSALLWLADNGNTPLAFSIGETIHIVSYGPGPARKLVIDFEEMED